MSADSTVFQEVGKPTNTVSITGNLFWYPQQQWLTILKDKTSKTNVEFDTATGHATVKGEKTSYDLVFDTSTGKFASIGGENPSVMLNMAHSLPV